MPSRISQSHLIQAILDSIKNAQKTYEQWSGGDWVAYAAEYVITCFVAESIMKIPGSKYLTIEHSCKDAINSACAKRRGPLPQASRPNGRIDLLLWWAKYKPRAIIEINNNVYNYVGCKADIDRIAKLLLKPNTTLQFGIFAFYSSADDREHKKAKEILQGRFGLVLERATDDWGTSLYVDGDLRIHPSGDGAFTEAYIIMKPSNNLRV